MKRTLLALFVMLAASMTANAGIIRHVVKPVAKTSVHVTAKVARTSAHAVKTVVY